MSKLSWLVSGCRRFLDAGQYRVVKVKMVREDRPSYFSYVAFAGRERLGVFDAGEAARDCCEQHFIKNKGVKDAVESQSKRSGRAS